VTTVAEAHLEAIRVLTEELAVAQTERATANHAYRREHARNWTALVDGGKSSTEAQRWADSASLVLRHEVEKLDAEIAGHVAYLAYHRDALSVALHCPE